MSDRRFGAKDEGVKGENVGNWRKDSTSGQDRIWQQIKYLVRF
jgi:hypothetical protein